MLCLAAQSCSRRVVGPATASSANSVQFRDFPDDPGGGSEGPTDLPRFPSRPLAKCPQQKEKGRMWGGGCLDRWKKAAGCLPATGCAEPPPPPDRDCTRPSVTPWSTSPSRACRRRTASSTPPVGKADAEMGLALGLASICERCGEPSWLPSLPGQLNADNSASKKKGDGSYDNASRLLPLPNDQNRISRYLTKKQPNEKL